MEAVRAALRSYRTKKPQNSLGISLVYINNLCNDLFVLQRIYWFLFYLVIMIVKYFSVPCTCVCVYVSVSRKGN